MDIIVSRNNWVIWEIDDLCSGDKIGLAYHIIKAAGGESVLLVGQPEQTKHDCYPITWFLNNRSEAGSESLPLMFAII